MATTTTKGETDKLRRTVVSLAKKRVVEGDDAGKTDEKYSDAVKKLAAKTRKPASSIRAWARRTARSENHSAA